MSDEATSVDERAHAILTELQAEGHDPNATEVQEPTPEAEAPAEVKAEAPAEDAAEARMKRINEWRAEQEARVAERSKRKDEEDLRAKIQELEARLAAPEQSTQQYDLSTPEGFFAAAAQAGVDPIKLGEFVSGELSNPSAVAQRAAREAVSPMEAKLMQMIEAQGQKLTAFEREQQERAQEHQINSAVRGFSEWVAESHQGSLAHKLLTKRGFDVFKNALGQAAGRYGVPESAGPDAYFDAVEHMLNEELSEVRSTFLDDTPSTAKRTAGQAQAKGVTTLTNKVASERSSVVQEDDYADLPIHERERLLIKSL